MHTGTVILEPGPETRNGQTVQLRISAFFVRARARVSLTDTLINGLITLRGIFS